MDSQTVIVALPGNVEAPIEKGSTLLGLAERLGSGATALGYAPIAALVDNELADLNTRIDANCTVRFLDIGTMEGLRVHERSLTIMLVKAVRDLYPERRVLIRHSVTSGVYFEVAGGTELLPDELVAIEARMRQLSERRIPFKRYEVSFAQAEKLLAGGRGSGNGKDAGSGNGKEVGSGSDTAGSGNEAVGSGNGEDAGSSGEAAGSGYSSEGDGGDIREEEEEAEAEAEAAAEDMAEASALAEAAPKSEPRNALHEEIRERRKPFIVFYEFDGYFDYSYGRMAPDSGYIDCFSLLYQYPGAIVTYPKRVLARKQQAVALFNEMPKLLGVFAEYKKWGRILGIENIGDLNKAVRGGGAPDIIRVAEALQEKRVSQIADAIANSPERKKIVLVAGPSSSGKTTFANRLAIQLRVNGLRASLLSMDNYYLDNRSIPLGPDGAPDIESPDALDIALFTEQLRLIAAGRSVATPVFDFKTGRRVAATASTATFTTAAATAATANAAAGQTIKGGDGHVLIVEGIHALNPKMTAGIPMESKHKIYISALTPLCIDDHNRIPTNDARLIRRIVRDHQFRGASALRTIRMWPSVRAGEERHIYPYQDTCDSVFNSGLIYELGAMRESALPLLSEIGRDCEEYAEASRLAKFLGYFSPIGDVDIPANSILREFLGGSCFSF